MTNPSAGRMLASPRPLQEMPHAQGGLRSIDTGATRRTDPAPGARGPQRPTAPALPDLLLADEGHTDQQIAAATGAGCSTVERVRQRFARAGLEAALNDKPRSGAPPEFDGEQQAMIVALACSDAPEGRTCWTAELLADRAVELGVAESISESTVRRILEKTR